ncbi:hypothetical protein TCON_2268 [Astathelohania contejeani]|uniref:SWIM-type domain-containing protein n=1 Tax=Astathelohania contejeani TaxID=164912 RepID=A0ABQ7HWG5_9MICR|nr:hypothetical protein TCON_2268 [Thelohania contejeani]
MLLSINDTFASKQEVIDAIQSYAAANRFNYQLEDSSDKYYALCCKGKNEFNCDAVISASLRKKDGLFVIKKIKLVHKCPPEIHQTNNLSSIEFLQSEINRATGNKSHRIGEIVSLLSKRNIKVGYFTVWNALHQNIEDITSENQENTKMIDKTAMALSDLLNEFLSINESAVGVSTRNMFYISFPEYLRFTRNVLEIKIFERKIEHRTMGEVIYSVVYDAIDTPQIFSFLVSERRREGDTFQNTLEEFIQQNSKNTPTQPIYIIEYDRRIINVFQSLNVNFFVKVRSVCKEFYSKFEDKELVVEVWNMCNSMDKDQYLRRKSAMMKRFNNIENELLNEIFTNEKHFIKCFNQPLFNVENFCDLEVDVIYSSVYGLTLFDCITSIMKLMADGIKKKEKIEDSESDLRSKFGNNVIYRVERCCLLARNCIIVGDSNIVRDDNIEFHVNLNENICECGKYQMFLIPCVHACALIMHHNENPYNYVSTIYLIETRNKMLKEITPVIDEPVRCASDRSLLRRGPGRPKKVCSKRKSGE